MNTDNNTDLLINQMLEDQNWVANWMRRQCTYNPSFPNILATLLLERDSDKKDQKEQMIFQQMRADAGLDEPELKARRLIYQESE